MTNGKESGLLFPESRNVNAGPRHAPRAEEAGPPLKRPLWPAGASPAVQWAGCEGHSVFSCEGPPGRLN